MAVGAAAEEAEAEVEVAAARAPVAEAAAAMAAPVAAQAVAARAAARPGVARAVQATALAHLDRGAEARIVLAILRNPRPGQRGKLSQTDLGWTCGASGARPKAPGARPEFSGVDCSIRREGSNCPLRRHWAQ